MATTELLTIEVVYALPEQQTLLTVKLPAGSTVAQAIEQSGLLARHPELDLSQHKVGVFAKVTALDTVLREHDRVEIYRALLADPKEVRRRRAAEGKVMRKGAGEAGSSS